MLCALIRNSLVVGVVSLEEQDIHNIAPFFEAVIDVTDLSPQPQIGWAFDGQSIAGTSVSVKITKLAMRQRFTIPELISILSYINSNPASLVAVLMQNLSVATFVDLARADTRDGIMYLVSIGMLTPERASIILNTVPTQYELYTS